MKSLVSDAPVPLAQGGNLLVPASQMRGEGSNRLERCERSTKHGQILLDELLQQPDQLV